MSLQVRLLYTTCFFDDDDDDNTGHKNLIEFQSWFFFDWLLHYNDDVDPVCLWKIVVHFFWSNQLTSIRMNEYKFFFCYPSIVDNISNNNNGMVYGTWILILSSSSSSSFYESFKVNSQMMKIKFFFHYY